MGVPNGHDKQKSRNDEISCFFHLLQVELSPLKLTLDCGSAFQQLPCSADTWVAMLLLPLLYRGDNKTTSSSL
jgi:hypothetical protein